MIALLVSVEEKGYVECFQKLSVTIVKPTPADNGEILHITKALFHT